MLTRTTEGEAKEEEEAEYRGGKTAVSVVMVGSFLVLGTLIICSECISINDISRSSHA